MKTFLLVLILLLRSVGGLAVTELEFPRKLQTQKLPFLSHTGPGPFDNALALNVEYGPVAHLKKQISANLNLKLDNFRGWDPAGEAHVTVITPPEYATVLSRFLNIQEIEKIAAKHRIQASDLALLGLGSGKKELLGRSEETFFLIVESNKLRAIRVEIWRAYIANGGQPGDWDPAWYFPHITVGYTKQDLHEPDVVKNIKYSYDKRFRLKN